MMNWNCLSKGKKRSPAFNLEPWVQVSAIWRWTERKPLLSTYLRIWALGKQPQPTSSWSGWQGKKGLTTHYKRDLGARVIHRQPERMDFRHVLQRCSHKATKWWKIALYISQRNQTAWRKGDRSIKLQAADCRFAQLFISTTTCTAVVQ